MKVLVCDRLHPLDDTAPSATVNVGMPQLSDAVADPSAALISDGDGLQPSVNEVPPTVATGGVISIERVAGLEIVKRPEHVSLTKTLYEPASLIATDAIVKTLEVAPAILTPPLRH